MEITGSGRTDKSVHARQQFFHFDTSAPVSTGQLTYKLNALLPPDIAIHDIIEVDEDAHARFSAASRAYCYEINPKKNPFLQDRSYFYSKPLNIHNMNKACVMINGEHDFESFSRVKTEVNHFLCNVFSAEWFEKGDQVIFYIKANRFLRGMVRSLVGTLLLLGESKINLATFRDIINSRDRKMAGRSVPGHGLFLTEVNYPKAIFK